MLPHVEVLNAPRFCVALGVLMCSRLIGNWLFVSPEPKNTSSFLLTDGYFWHIVVAVYHCGFT